MDKLSPEQRKLARERAIELRSPICPYCGKTGVNVTTHGDREQKFLGLCGHRWSESDLQENNLTEPGAPSKESVPTLAKSKGLRRFGFSGLCFLVALSLFGINRGCSSVNAPPSWIAATIWFGAVTLLVVAGIWLWDQTANRHPLLRTMLSLAAIGVMAGLTYEPIKQQYNRERPVPNAASPPPVQATISTPVPREHPPGEKANVPQLALMFKESPLFTPAVKARIAQDISAFAVYLSRIGLQTPSELPPIGLTLNAHGASSGGGGDKTYDVTINIGEKDIGKREVATDAYALYAISQVMTPPRKVSDINGGIPKWLMEYVAVHYLNSSFWDDRPTQEKSLIGRWVILFWKIRERWPEARGRTRFADSLVAYTVREVADEIVPLKPWDEKGPQLDKRLNTYIYTKMSVADSVVDNACSRLPEITDIARQAGIELDALSHNDQLFVDARCGR